MNINRFVIRKMYFDSLNLFVFGCLAIIFMATNMGIPYIDVISEIIGGCVLGFSAFLLFSISKQTQLQDFTIDKLWDTFLYQSLILQEVQNRIEQQKEELIEAQEENENIQVLQQYMNGVKKFALKQFLKMQVQTENRKLSFTNLLVIWVFANSNSHFYTYKLFSIIVASGGAIGLYWLGHDLLAAGWFFFYMCCQLNIESIVKHSKEKIDEAKEKVEEPSEEDIQQFVQNLV